MKKFLQNLMLIAALMATWALNAQSCPPVTITDGSPFSEDFSSYTASTSVSSMSSFPSCWVSLYSGTSAGYAPHVYTGSYAPNSGDKALVMTSGGANYGSDNYVVLPEFTNDVSGYVLSFSYRMENATNGSTLTVGYVTSVTDGSTFQPFESVTSVAGTKGETEITLGAVPSGARIAFRWSYTTSYYSCAIDDILLTLPPSCPKPVRFVVSDITDVTVSVAWEIGLGDSDFQVACLPATETFDESTASWTNVTGTSYTFNNLTPNTAYKVYARRACTAGDYSDVVEANASTISTPATIPYACGFEDAMENAAWTFDNATAANKWCIGGAVHNGTDSDSALYISNDNGTSNAYSGSYAHVFAYRPVTVADDGIYNVGFDWRCKGYSTTYYMRAAMVPTALPLPAANNTSTTTGFPTATTLPAGWIPIDGGEKLNLQDTWQTYTDAVNLSAGTYNIVFYWCNVTSATYNPPAAVDNISIAMSTCPSVDSITYANRGTTSIDLTMHTNSTGANFQFWYAVYGTEDYDTLLFTNNTFTLDNLQPSTYYQGYVRPICNGTDTSWGIFAYQFSTACGAVSEFPWDFDDENCTFMQQTQQGSTVKYPYCWKNINGGYGSYYWSNSTSYAHTGDRSFYFSGGNSSANHNDDWLITSQINLTGSEELSFWLRCSSNSTATYTYRSKIQVWASTSECSGQTDTAHFVPLNIPGYGTQIVKDSNYWEQFIVPLSGLNGPTYLAFVVKADSCYTTYMDDIRIYTRSSCPDAVDPHLTAYTHNSASMAWSDTSSTNVATSWDVYFGEAGFIADTVTPITVTTNSCDITDLVPSTDYEFYVVAHCTDGSTANATPRIMFTTSCVPVVELPYTENFESYTTGSSSPIDPCWNKHYLNGSTQTDVSTSYPYPYTSAAINGNLGLYFYAYKSTSYVNESFAVLPAFEAPLNSLQMKLKVKRYSSTSATYKSYVLVGVVSNPDDISTFDTVQVIDLTSQPAGTISSEVVSFANYEGNGTRIALYASAPTVTSTGYNYIYVDDILVDHPASCANVLDLDVAAVDAYSATIAWTDTSVYNASVNYKVYYGLAGFDADTVTPVVVTDTFVVLSGLTPSTQYEYYVLPYCEDGTDAGFDGRLQFTTGCAPIATLPYVENFESYSSGSSNPISPCWVKHHVSGGVVYTTNFPYPYSTAAINGGMGLYFMSTASASASPSYCYAALPLFEADINDLQISFNMKRTGNYVSYLLVGVMSNPEDISTFDTVAVLDITAQGNGTVVPQEVSFDAYTGTGRYITIYAPIPTLGSSASIIQNPSYIDDVVVSELPNCRRPNTLASDNVTAHTADLSWQNSSSSVSGYLLAVSTQRNFDPDTCSNVVQLTDNYTTLSNLDSYSTYYWSVRAICGSGDSSDWAFVKSFQTLYDCGDGYNNILDTIGDGTSSSYSYTMYAYSTYPSGYSASIFTAAELAEMGLSANNTINSISLHTGSTGGTIENVRVYMSEVLTDAFSSSPASDTAALFGDMTLVFQGDLICNADQWHEIVFDSSFFYSGANNLLIRMVRGTASANITHYYTNMTPDYRTVYGYRSASSSTHTASRAYYRPNIAFNICSEIPVCDRPANVALDNLQPTSCTVIWQGDAASYEVAYGPAGFSPDSVDAQDATHANTSDTAFTMTGLAPQTGYAFYVRSLCASGDVSDWTIALDFTTPCAAREIPYTEDFEAYGSGSTSTISPCWTKATNSSTQYPYPYSTNAINGTRSLYFYAYHPSSATATAYYCYAALPLMNAPLDTLMLSFNMRRYSTTTESYTSRLVVGVMTDPNDIATFQPVDTIDLRNEPALAVRRIEVPFDSYTGNGQYIAIYDEVPPLYPSTTSVYSYAYVDDIVVDYIPSCLTPTDVTVSNITTSSATVSWNGTASNYEVRYESNGTVNTFVVNADSATLTGLNPASSYTVDVRGICAVGDTGNWSSPATFYTACALITNFPYFENFENTIGTTSSTGANNLPNCWNYENNGTSYTNYPIVYSSTTYAYSGNNSLRFYIYNTTAYGEQTALLPEMDHVGTLQLAFMGATSSTTYIGTSKVAIGVYSNSTYHWLDTVSFTSTDFAEYEIPLSGFADTIGQIAIRGIHPASSYCVVNIDDIEVAPIPTCIKPADLAVDPMMTTATVTWTEAATSNGDYEIRYGLAGTAIDNCTSVFGNGVPATVANLTPGTDYDLYVRSICGAGDSSRFVQTSFTTLTAMPVTSFPYSCNFNDGCGQDWEIVNGNQTNKWVLGVLDATTPNDSVLMISNNGGLSNDYTIGSASVVYAYRSLSLNPGEYSYSFDWRANGEGNYDYLRVALVPSSMPMVAGELYRWAYDASPEEALLLDGGNKLNLNTNFTTRTGTVTVPTAGTYRFMILWRNDASSGNPPAGAIDNVEINLNTCPAPVNIHATNVTTTSFDLDWTDMDASAQQWIVDYGTGSQVVTAHPVSIMGLAPAHSYPVRVRSVCSATDTGMWSPVVNVPTLCDIIPVSVDNPYVQDFNAVEGTTYNTAGILPPCWEAYFNGTDSIYLPHVTSSGSYWYSPDSTNAMVMTSGSGTTYGNTKLVRLPEFTGAVSDLSMTFWSKQESTTNGVLSVGYFTSDTLESSFVAVGTVTSSTTGKYDTVSFADVPATARYIGFQWYHNSTYYSNCIDNVTVTSVALTCGAPSNMAVSDVTYQGATALWSGAGENYEIGIKAVAAPTWDVEVPVAGHTYAFTGLTPATDYMYRVRQNCDTIGYSDWSIGTFTTAELPCFVPTAVAADAEGTTASISWTAGGDETQWVINVFNTVDNIMDTVNTNPAVVAGLMPATQYSVAVAALCGNGTLQSDWSDTVSFTTVVCEPVTNVTASNVTANSAVISWTNNSNGATEWVVEYGPQGFGSGQGTTVNVTTNPFTITNLESEMPYDVYVRAVCGENWVSDNSQKANFTTLAGEGIANVDGMVNVSIYPNPASGSTTISLTGIEGTVEVSVVDMSGRRVMSEKMECGADCVKTIDVKNLSQGAYFVRIQGEGANIVKKLIVK